MDSLVEVLDVELSELDAEHLCGYSLDRPKIGSDDGAFDGTYALQIDGWALGRHGPVVAVELVSRGSRLWRIEPRVSRPDVAETFPDVSHAARSGFSAPVNTLPMGPEFVLGVRAVLEDGTSVDLATIRGRRAGLPSRVEPRLRPLMITTLGRTGSTALMRTLRLHPELVVCSPTERDAHIASYWAAILRELSEPASYFRQFGDPVGGAGSRSWWSGASASVPPRITNRELERVIGVEGVTALAEFCQALIEATYESLAASEGKADPIYFVEKFQVTMILSLIWELYPQAKEVFLVRDPRDRICSVLAYNARKGTQRFGRERVTSDEEYVRKPMRSSLLRMVEAWNSRSERAHLLRYEDLVLRPVEAVEGLLRYLDLDINPKIVAAMVNSYTERGTGLEGQRTVSDARKTVGRWRNELSDELKLASHEALGFGLEAFGYPS